MRDPSDHGEAQDAIDYVLDVLGDFTDTFLRCWREGDLSEWPEFYAWLDKREADDKAWRAAEKKRLKGWRLPPAKSDASVRAISEQGNPATDELNTSSANTSSKSI